MGKNSGGSTGGNSAFSLIYRNELCRVHIYSQAFKSAPPPPPPPPLGEDLDPPLKNICQIYLCLLIQIRSSAVVVYKKFLNINIFTSGLRWGSNFELFWSDTGSGFLDPGAALHANFSKYPWGWSAARRMTSEKKN